MRRIAHRAATLGVLLVTYYLIYTITLNVLAYFSHSPHPYVYLSRWVDLPVNVFAAVVAAWIALIYGRRGVKPFHKGDRVLAAAGSEPGVIDDCVWSRASFWGDGSWYVAVRRDADPRNPVLFAAVAVRPEQSSTVFA